MPGQKATILVVDDDVTLRNLLVDTLIAIGYTAVAASDGIEALERLSERKYDLIISDVKMPGLDGVALLKKIRLHFPDLPVLFITGVATPEVIGRASPDGFLAKPFRISHLEELIEEALQGKTEEAVRPIRKVMVVDDDDFFRDMLAEALRYNDYIPCAVAGAEEALRELERGVVDAVIADIKMPGMDGITLLKQIKEKYPQLPVILITAFYSHAETTKQAGAVAPNGFLHKPFDVDNIIDILKSIKPQTTSKRA
ncbi:MAG TPA: response regulator [Candidatus Deferrimicrobium sp.]|nr:response regulator [Candidatus Deferrimicrobium sp.]